jgi:hypothetical protein
MSMIFAQVRKSLVLLVLPCCAGSMLAQRPTLSVVNWQVNPADQQQLLIRYHNNGTLAITAFAINVQMNCPAGTKQQVGYSADLINLVINSRIDEGRDGIWKGAILGGAYYDDSHIGVTSCASASYDIAVNGVLLSDGTVLGDDVGGMIASVKKNRRAVLATQQQLLSMLAQVDLQNPTIVQLSSIRSELEQRATAYRKLLREHNAMTGARQQSAPLPVFDPAVFEFADNELLRISKSSDLSGALSAYVNDATKRYAAYLAEVNREQ